MTTTSPCRLFVFLASDKLLAVVLRRGPSAWTRLSVWRTDNDTFEHGQWFRGHVYERRSDLAPDGSLFVYFARKDRPAGRGDINSDSRIAISKPPWFTAPALWGIGGTYCIGGTSRARASSIWAGSSTTPTKARSCRASSQHGRSTVHRPDRRGDGEHGVLQSPTPGRLASNARRGGAASMVAVSGHIPFSSRTRRNVRGLASTRRADTTRRSCG